jgi:cytochrome c551
MASQPPHNAFPEPSRPAPSGGSKASRRGLIAIIVAVIAFGLGVPAWVVADNIDSGASKAAGVHLTAAQEKGRELFSQSCYVCHALKAANAVGRIGPDLDVRVGTEIPMEPAHEALVLSIRKELVLNAILEGRARGLGNMPAALYQGKEAEDIASFVAAVAGR